jgi:hypothetical protein
MFDRFASMDLATLKREVERLRVVECSPEAFRVSPSGTPPPLSYTPDEFRNLPDGELKRFFLCWLGRVPDTYEARLLFSWPEDERDAYASPVRH